MAALPLRLPGVQEKREPEAVELVRDFWIQEREESTDIIHAVHLGEKGGEVCQPAWPCTQS